MRRCTVSGDSLAGCRASARWRRAKEARAVKITMKLKGMDWNDSARMGEVNCPNGHPVRFTVGDARRNATLRCSRCPSTVTIDGTRFFRDVDDTLRRAFK